MAISDKDGVIVLGDSPIPSNNITIKTPAVADGTASVFQGVPTALGKEIAKFGAEGLSVSALNGGQLAGFRNLLINGDFKINQRGTSFNSGVNALTFTSDRWIVAAAGASVSVNVVNDSSGFNYLAVTPSAAGNTVVNFRQRIESWNIRHLKGKQITVSFYLYSVNGLPTKGAVLLRTPSAVDNYSTVTNAASAIFNVGSTARHFVTFELPENAKNGVELVLEVENLPLGSTLVVRDIQLEPGAIATPFEQRPYGIELALCQRYYETGYIVQDYYSGAAGMYSTYIRSFLVSKRTAPSISLSSITYSNSYNLFADFVVIGSFRAVVQSSNGGACAYNALWAASAEL